MADRYRVGDNVSNTKEIAHFATPLPEPANENSYIETLPGDPRSRPVLTATEFSSNNSHKKKSTSFQITSVTVQGSRLGNDTGDDSADDLDESHTEDISSDVLDCSKTTDLDNELVSSDNSNANVEEFGLSSLVLPSIQPVPIKSGDSSVNFTVPLTIGVTPDHFTDVTIEPNVANTGVTLVTTTTSPPGVTAQVPMVNSMPDHWQHRFKVVKIVSSEPFKRGRWLCMDFTDPPAIHNEPKADTTEINLQNNSTEPLPSQNSINILTTVELASDKPNAGGVTHVYEFPVNQSIPGSIAVKLNSNQAASQPVYSILVPVSSVPAANSIQTPSLTNTAATGVQMGSNIIAPVSSIAQNVGVQTAPVTVISSSQPPVTTTTTTAVLPNQNNNIPATNIQQQPMMGSSTMVVSNPSVVQINQAPPPTQLPQTSNVTLQQQTQELNQLPQQQPIVSNIPIVQGTSLLPPTTSEINNLSVNVSSAMAESSQPVLAAQQRKNILDTNTNIATPTSAISNNSQSPLLEMLPDALGTKALQDGDDPESAPAGTSTVAIDNKIEQAMDLVKSHLMFAVREEVDVLKEKITELMDRISQLELENGILKANATQETLSQLPPPSGTQVNPQVTQQNNQTGTQTLPTNGGQIIRPPNSNQNQTQNNQQTTTS